VWIEEVVMAKIIEFYVPERFRKKTRWISADRRGNVIVFHCSREEICINHMASTGGLGGGNDGALAPLVP
jgi:hypothetical protein